MAHPKHKILRPEEINAEHIIKQPHHSGKLFKLRIFSSVSQGSPECGFYRGKLAIEKKGNCLNSANLKNVI